MKSALPQLIAASVALLFIPAATQAADRLLLDPSERDIMDRITGTDARVSLNQSGERATLRVMTGTNTSWPGITLRAPGQAWDLSPHAEVTVSIQNPGEEQVLVHCRVDNAGADGQRNCVTSSSTIEPGKTGTIRVHLKRTSDDTMGGKLFGMRGYPVRTGGPGTVNPTNITQLLLFVSKPAAVQVFDVREIRAGGTYTAPTAWTSDADPFIPFIDTFGQYRHKDWPGKVKSEEDLVARRDAESLELKAQPGPKGWCEYGGWLNGPKLEGTGFFRTEKIDGKWWLVDPEGHLFFSQGIDCVRMLDTTPVQQREEWFENFSGTAMTQFISQAYALKGHYAGNTVRCYSFAGANLARKYGPDWATNYLPVVHRRLRSWGINTIANWSDQRTFLMRRTAYTDNLGSGRAKNIEGSEGYWGKFPDVFDPSFLESVRRSMETRKGRSAGDPWCIGYFSDNEMSWGDEMSIGLATLKSGPEQAAKQNFMQDLKLKYSSIAKLNDAWGAKYDSWDDLLEARTTPNPARARQDLTAFYSKAAERYFMVVRDAIRDVAPNQLYLGCRFAWVNARAAAAAAKYCDVVSYNLYTRSVADFQFNGGADVPLIIGEFHFGALDRGLFHTGLVPVPNQEERAAAYKNYVLGAVKHPQFVGCHWFQYQDEPTTGRVYDEENYQIGFVDIADTPYPEMIKTSRELAEMLYQQNR